MKRKLLLMLILSSIVFFSCTDYTPEKLNKKDSKEVTTVEIQDMQKDTLIVSIDGNKMYVFNDDNLVEYKIHTYDQSMCTPVGDWYIFISALGLFIALVVILNAIFD